MGIISYNQNLDSYQKYLRDIRLSVLSMQLKKKQICAILELGDWNTLIHEY